jgi:hypothetical protein
MIGGKRIVLASWVVGAVLVGTGIVLAGRDAGPAHAARSPNGRSTSLPEPCSTGREKASTEIETQRVGGSENPCLCTIRIEPD